MSIITELASALRRVVRIGLASLVVLALGDALGGARIAVLDFELKDLTLEPGTPAEVRRTASLRSRLEQALRDLGDYQPVVLDPVAVARANPAVGYLYDHPDLAAELGRSVGAEWVLVGRLHKPSFLFAYLMGRLVDAHSGAVVADLVVEAKGQAGLVTERGAMRLAEQIDRAIKTVGRELPRAP